MRSTIKVIQVPTYKKNRKIRLRTENSFRGNIRLFYILYVYLGLLALNQSLPFLGTFTQKLKITIRVKINTYL